MIGIGGASRFCILKSQKEDNKAQMIFATSVKLGFILGLVFVLIGIFGSGYIAKILGADRHTLPMAKTYINTIFTFAPFLLLNNILTAFVRNDGNPNLSMVAMLAGSFSNIILDYVFIFPLKMGMFGAAFATGLAPGTSIILLLLHFAKRKATIWFLKPRLSGSGFLIFQALVCRHLLMKFHQVWCLLPLIL